MWDLTLLTSLTLFIPRVVLYCFNCEWYGVVKINELFFKEKEMRMEGEDMYLYYSTLTAFSHLHFVCLHEVYRHFNFSSMRLCMWAPSASPKVLEGVRVQTALQAPCLHSVLHSALCTICRKKRWKEALWFGNAHNAWKGRESYQYCKRVGRGKKAEINEKTSTHPSPTTLWVEELFKVKNVYIFYSEAIKCIYQKPACWQNSNLFDT